MKRNNILTALALTMTLTVQAQTQDVRQEIINDVRLSASNYLAYRGPQHTLSAAPRGYEPFYISHYGRHGSRFLIGNEDYDWPLKVLQEADEKGKLSKTGSDVLQRVKRMREESRLRMGELTPLGAEQHRQIARRMYERFPEVFRDDVRVEARSTVVIRCILSMENELQELLRMNPRLQIFHDASEHEMFYMNQQDKKLFEKKMPRGSKTRYDEFCQRHKCHSRLVASLFNDSLYAHYDVDGERLCYQLFKLASNLQSSELAKEMTLYDLFTEQELYENWLQTNAWWYLNYGNCALNGGTQPYSQRNLLRNIIQQADSCLALERPGATLRFGHETMVMPLTCLLGLNGYDRQVDDLEQLPACGWANYRIFPMAANVQFIFYRHKKNHGDILLKVLLNEDEATLPIDTDCAPYYHWQDFRSHYLQLLDQYKED